MRTLVLALAASLCACTGSVVHDEGNLDAGKLPPPYQPLDQSHADLTIAADDATQMAAVTLHLIDASGTAVSMQQGQQVTVNGTALAQSGAGAYAATVAISPAYSVVVDEPRHGVPSTTFAPPQDFALTSGTFSLSGTTLTWAPVETTATTVSVALSQQTPDGPQSAQYMLMTDTGSKTLTETDLRNFVQGVPLDITLTKTNTGLQLEGVATSTVTLSRAVKQSVNPGP